MGPIDPVVRLLPFQIADRGDTVYLRRGSLQVMFEGEGIVDILARLQEVSSGRYVSRADILSHFPPVLHDRIDAVVRHLISRQIAELRAPHEVYEISDAPETGEDIFFWEVGMSRAEIAQKTDRLVVLVGLNRVSLGLRDNLRSYGSWQVSSVDDIPLRNHALLESTPELLEEALPANAFEQATVGAALVVACAEFGGIGLLKPWNALCIQREIPFLPVIVQDAGVQVGPLAVADETACLACLEARENSVLREKAKERRLMEEITAVGQGYASSHPAVLQIAATLSAFEVLRFSAGIYPMRVGKRLDFNIMSSSMVASRVLKAPRCPVCSPLRHAGQLSLEKPQLAPEKWAKVEAMGGSYDGD